MDYVLTLAVASVVAYVMGRRAQAREARPKRPPHRSIVVGVEGFCRLIRGWEWVQPDGSGGTVGVRLSGVGGTTGMQLAIVQVEREIASGNVLPIRLDRVGSLIYASGGRLAERILDDPEAAAREGIRLGDQA